VVVPARNEAASIEGCLDHLLAQDLPLDRLEVVVVDGGSADDTRARAERRLEGSGLARWLVLDNPAGTTPSNLNRGLAEVRAPVVCRVDARSFVPPDYVRTCAELLAGRGELAVVGGAQVARPARATVVATGIARALNNRVGMGGARYRSGAPSGPADTVYLGAFRTAELREAGGWDERLGTNQDFDLNRRMSAYGLVWFAAELAVAYEPRASLGALWDQYRRFGEGKVRYWYLTGDPPRPRQLVLLGAPVVGAVLGTLVLARLGRSGRIRLVGAGLALGVLVEVRGSPGPSGGPAVHAVAAAASGVTALAWLQGVYGALARRAVGRDVRRAARGVSR
jgi:succinoglycan biosynthesis protein ExoA